MTVTKPPKHFSPHIHPENFDVLSHFTDPQRMAGLWEQWLNYKWGEHKQKYKTAESEVTQLRQLWKRCNGDTDTAAQIIEQSVGNLWKGLFDLKKETHGRPTNRATEQHKDLARYIAEKRFARIARENEPVVGGAERQGGF